MKILSDRIRNHFPSLKSGAIFFDNPGGTQVPREVIEAVSHYYTTANANSHGRFRTSQETTQMIGRARQAMADFLNASSPGEIVFGQNMTSLTFHFSRSIARSLAPGDEIMVTTLDHDANIAPWLSLQEKGVVIQWLDIREEDCSLDTEEFKRKLSSKTKLVALGYASNAVGTINNLEEIIPLAHEAGALVYVDAVHYAPHGPIDVTALDCDFLACSVYKFYGPHMGALYGKSKVLEKLEAYKVRPAPGSPPEKFETGTLNHEGLAGTIAAIDFLASIGEKYGLCYRDDLRAFKERTLLLKMAMTAIKSDEAELFMHLFNGLQTLRGIKIYGLRDRERFDRRTPTVAFTIEGISPGEIARRLDDAGIYVWDGNYYALALMERLGLESTGGAVRVGLCYYNTFEEIDTFLRAMKEIVK